MLPTRQGSIHLFRLAGIDLFLHWSWFVVAAFEINSRARSYSTLMWNVLEYLALFVVVLMHEFGHALACRQVGGRADQIVLWPLGGVAYVAPPQRPGATLWSIAAGPLVNVVLLVALMLAGMVVDLEALRASAPNAYGLWRALVYINVGLLMFNLLPIYPLDGGQILRSLLWFVLGRARSLLVASIVGFIGVGALALFAFSMHSVWFIILSVFILMNCWRGLLQARALARAAGAPRQAGVACPACGSTPPVGAFWVCGRCRVAFDTFATGAVCPSCGARYAVTYCLDCGEAHPLSEWQTGGGFSA